MPQLIISTNAKGYTLHFGTVVLPCLVGRSGIISADAKTEGDGATPAGIWALRQVLFRADRLRPPKTQLPTTPIKADDGWCDDANAPQYNQPVALPFDGSHERLWRDDAAYDIIIPLGYNDNPPHAHKGSAIFFHCTTNAMAYTQGCVAIDRAALLALLPSLDTDTVMVIPEAWSPIEQ